MDRSSSVVRLSGRGRIPLPGFPGLPGILGLLGLGLHGCDGSDDLAAGPGLAVSVAAPELTELAQQAVDASPTWLQDDLEVALGRLSDSLQDELGALVVDLDDPWLTDEVAFGIAHTSPEVLEYDSFHPELFVLNAELLYAYDADLDYVELVDVGEPGVDADYYTTTEYRVLTEEGQEETRTTPQDIYYWYVVHPRLEDELPAYIDAWSSSAYTTPEEGAFWRDWLWDDAAEGCTEGRTCPLLSEELAGVEVLWESRTYASEDNGAIGVLIQYVQTALDFGAGSERPVQPSRIYAVGAGNCGEHADLTSAAARVALIPCQNVGAWSNDHTWNEFYDEGWMQWEPVNTYVGHWTYYVDENGDYYRTYDGQDNDCDGIADDGEDTSDEDADGWTIADGDCDDTDAGIHPEAEEVANARDDDCDGVADSGFLDLEADADGDGWSIADGDCDDMDDTRYPGATEEENGVDDDCDGLAEAASDTAGDTADADGDGWTVADGDCDDTDAAVEPLAEEEANGYDDDCDGVADEGFSEADRDGDGSFLADGDCDDTASDTWPGADDPDPSSNRVYAISAARGDTWISSERTVDYSTPAYLDFYVTDDEFTPVDGAMVTVYGTWAVYGYDDYLAFATEAVTDLEGYAQVVVGEANPYYFTVTAPFEGASESGVSRVVEWSEPGETYETEGWAEGIQPGSLPVSAAEPPGADAVEMILDLTLTVSSYRVAGDGMYYGSFSLTRDGGDVDWFVLDEDQYALLAEGEPFEALAWGEDATGVETSVELSRDRAWYVVIANPDTNVLTMSGELEVTLSSSSGEQWAEGTPALQTGFHVPSGDLLAVEVQP